MTMASAGKIRREAHLPIKRIGGFMRSHYMPPSGVCSRRIGPADAMVIDIGIKNRVVAL